MPQHCVSVADAAISGPYVGKIDELQSQFRRFYERVDLNVGSQGRFRCRTHNVFSESKERPQSFRKERSTMFPGPRGGISHGEPSRTCS